MAINLVNNIYDYKNDDFNKDIIKEMEDYLKKMSKLTR